MAANPVHGRGARRAGKTPQSPRNRSAPIHCGNATMPCSIQRLYSCMPPPYILRMPTSTASFNLVQLPFDALRCNPAINHCRDTADTDGKQQHRAPIHTPIHQRQNRNERHGQHAEHCTKRNTCFPSCYSRRILRRARHHRYIQLLHKFTRRNRSALKITDTELKLMAAAAMMGESKMPRNGYNTPAATGTPNEL